MGENFERKVGNDVVEGSGEESESDFNRIGWDLMGARWSLISRMNPSGVNPD